MEPLPLQLHGWHAAHGAAFTSLGGLEVVARFPDEPASGPALFDWSARQVLKATGEDRLSFLHGMCTAEVKGLPAGGAAYAAFLTSKGAMVADGRIWNLGEALLIDVEPGRLPAVREYLEKHLVSEEVELSDASGEHAVLSLASFAGRPPAPHPAAPSRLPGGVDLLVPRAELAATWERLVGSGLRPAGFEAWEMRRIEAGVPRFGQDMDERTIPLEANLEAAISYQKGCYVGQEVIARATFRGHVNRKLARLSFGGRAPAAGAEIRAGERVVGRVTSVVRAPDSGSWIGLGYLHRDVLGGGGGGDVALAAEGAEAVQLRA
jgi:folate-binding protein YgfZ